MRIKTSFILVFIVFILAVGTVFAGSPHEQFKQMVEQLQKNPIDNALREKIIKLAQELKPAPAVPEEAERRMVRGTAAFESAKDVSGYENAAREFQAATNAAPWYQDAYFNLGVAQEMSGKFNEAMESFRMCLLAAPDGKDVAEVKKRIYKLEYAAEEAAKVAAVEAEKKRKQQETESVLNRLKQEYGGVSYYQWTCFKGTWDNALCGCTWDEYHGSNWHRTGWEETARFSFPGDGTVVFAGELLGRPNGPSFSDIKWEYHILTPDNRVYSKYPTWVELRNDGIIYSNDENNVSPSANPSVKHSYCYWRRDRK